MANKVCPNCGEEYSDTYRKCPFCAEEAAIAHGKKLRRGGKRSAKRQSSGGALGVMLLLAVVIVAGVLVYIFFGDQIAGFMGIRPGEDVADGGGQGGGDVTPPPGGQEDDGGQGGQQDGDGQGGGVTPPDDGGGQEQQPPVVPTPLTLVSPPAFTIPAGNTGRVSVSGGSGEIVWTSSNPEIATVADGAVTGVAGGTVTITATCGEESVSCQVTVDGEPWVSGTAFSLNKDDFTISREWPNPVQLKIQGGDYSSAAWSSSNTGVATVSDGGLVSRVGKGVATITVVVDGQTLTCIVRCDF